MSIKPILFNTEMVRAVLDGRKIVTRRACKIGVNGNEAVEQEHCVAAEYPTRNYKGICANFFDNDGFYSGAAYPPYRPGDILYVRETWAKTANYATNPPSNIFIYKADHPNYPNCAKWRPSIHMPREAARIFLRVTDVRVERLQSMTDRDAEKEGVGNLFLETIGFGNKDYGCMTYSDSQRVIGLEKEQFAHLWDSTIKPADRAKYGWAANPWVWAIAFERCEKPEMFDNTQ